MTVRPNSLAEQDRHRADAAGAAMDEHGLALAAHKPRWNRLVQTVKKVSGSAAASTMRERRRHRQALAGRRDAIFGIAAAGDQGADRLADSSSSARPRRPRRRSPGDLQAREWTARRAAADRGRSRCITSGRLTPGRLDPDQHLARRPARGTGRSTGSQHLRPAGRRRDRSRSSSSGIASMRSRLAPKCAAAQALRLDGAARQGEFCSHGPRRALPGQARRSADPAGKQDLDPLSVDELHARIEALEARDRPGAGEARRRG